MTFGMSNSIKPTPEFKRDLKPLLKKYRTLKETILNLEQTLIKNPYLGESYGHGINKIRIADPSKGKGKSGGFRILYYHLTKTEQVSKCCSLISSTNPKLSQLKRRTP